MGLFSFKFYQSVQLKMCTFLNKNYGLTELDF